MVKKQKYEPSKNIDVDFIFQNMNLNFDNKRQDCHYNAQFLCNILKELGYDVKLCSGYYVNPPKTVRHSWIEYEDKILETDCRQLHDGDGDLMPNEFCAVLSKEELGHRYKKEVKI